VKKKQPAPKNSNKSSTGKKDGVGLVIKKDGYGKKRR